MGSRSRNTSASRRPRSSSRTDAREGAIMNPTYKIHPAIGIARVGNSPTDFYLAPESIGALPIEVDPSGRILLVNGQEQTITTFRDANSLVKRQAARFRVYIYDDQSPQGRLITVGAQPHGE